MTKNYLYIILSRAIVIFGRRFILCKSIASLDSQFTGNIAIAPIDLSGSRLSLSLLKLAFVQHKFSYCRYTVHLKEEQQ